MAKWIEYTGSDEQIEEINNSEYFLLKRKDGDISFVLYPPYHPNEMDNETTIEYLIGEPHQYANMICKWAKTGCPVWYRFKATEFEPGIETEKPDWFNDELEFRLTPFGD